MNKINNIDITKFGIPKLKDSEITAINDEIDKFSNSLVARGEKRLTVFPELDEKQLAIDLVREDLSKTNIFSFKRKILKKVLKSLENK